MSDRVAFGVLKDLIEVLYSINDHIEVVYKLNRSFLLIEFKERIAFFEGAHEHDRVHVVIADLHDVLLASQSMLN